MSAKDWIDIIDHVFWWIVGIGFFLYLLGFFDKE
jgi:hypothetical protein